MKKLYIPTSTLNFNNILSSESISPKAFYAQRGFGYSRWTEIPENNIDTAILLYEKPFRFVRPVSDMEDHPMLIEICTDEDFPSMSNGIFYTDHTIYLSPWRTKFIFFSKQDRHTVLSMSDSSLETKLISIYKSRMVVEEYPYINLSQDSNDWLHIELNIKELERDYRINKMKGLLYGYYIGSILSESPEATRKYNILQELQDIFSAVLSSESHELTGYQNTRLSVLFGELQKTITVISFLQSKLANPQEIEDVINQCVRLGTIFPDIINKKSIIEALKYPSNKDNFALNWLNREWDKLDSQICKESKPLAISSEEIVVADCSLGKIVNSFVLDLKENEMMKAWINSVLLSKAYNGKVSLFKKELSDAVTVKAKEVYGEQWYNSSNKQALNQMRRYVQGQESSFEWNNYLISSIAAVIAKGDDWNKLLDFMRSKGMSDYRLAFAFYGELNGFANLTRDFTDNLFELEDKRYVADVYTELYGQLVGVSPKLQNNNEIGFIEKVEPVRSFKEKVWDSWNRIKKGLNKQKNLEAELERVLEQNKENQDISVFMEKLDSKIWKRTNQPWEKLYKELNPNYESNLVEQRKRKRMKREGGKTLFDYDLPYLECLQSFPSSAKERLEANWNFTANGKIYMSDDHIKHFINLCKQDGNGIYEKHQELKGLFTDDVAKLVKEELKKKSNDR